MQTSEVSKTSEVCKVSPTINDSTGNWLLVTGNLHSCHFGTFIRSKSRISDRCSSEKAILGTRKKEVVLK